MTSEITLEDTIELMKSEDYKNRLKAELQQTAIRYNKLHRMIIKYEAGMLEFELTCDIELLKRQEKAMEEYLHCLEVRVLIEKI